jgi:hypothetical protein
MSNWKYWPPIGDRDTVNFQLGNVETCGKFTYPYLHDRSDFILASDYSGEHEPPEFQVLSFLLTHQNSVFGQWEAARLSVRNKHLSDGRRMAFKKLNDAQRINALDEFLEAASLLNGVLVCVAVEKRHSLRSRGKLLPLQHKWTPDTLEKLLRICVFGGGFVDGLRGDGQNIFWITDDDAIVATDNAKADACGLMGSFLHSYPGEEPEIKLGIASGFDDGLRAEDLLAIPDLAAGAFSEGLTQLGKSRMPTTTVGPTGVDLSLQIKSMLIEAWRIDNNKPLKHFNTVIRVADGGQDMFSFNQPIIRMPQRGQPLPPAQILNEKWRRALTETLKRLTA